MAISVASALVSSRLDQKNFIVYGAASKHTDRLQRVQKALARIVMHQRLHCSPLSSMHYSKTFIGYLLNDFYASNWLP